MAHLLLMRTQNGLLAVQSPGLHCEAITAYGNLYSGISLVHSAKGSRIVYSSLNFTGNQSLRIRESDPVRGDFRPLADSPNVLKDGRVIGSFPAATGDGQAKR